jgi:ankyrin repeat protein
VECLINHKASLFYQLDGTWASLKDEYQRTPLHLAICSHKKSKAEKLVKSLLSAINFAPSLDIKSECLDACMKSGHTALTLAIERDYHEIIKVLLRRNASIHSGPSLYYAVGRAIHWSNDKNEFKRAKEFITYLLAKGVDILQSNAGYTALHRILVSECSERICLELIDLLLDKSLRKKLDWSVNDGAVANLVSDFDNLEIARNTPSNDQPEDWAAQQNNAYLINATTSRGEYIVLVDGCTAVEDGCTAVEDGCTAVEDGCTTVEDGRTALSLACEKGYTRCVKILLEAGTEVTEITEVTQVTQADNRGWTPAHYTAVLMQYEDKREDAKAIIQLLRAHGDSLTQRDSYYDCSPADWVMSYGISGNTLALFSPVVNSEEEAYTSYSTPAFR